ncbi:DUF1993 family protein [Sphingomonas faeni]|uniref:DUF1993 family protein n=1 Tax=Sphingomonas faeni TaxID=185950 RepID=UPI00278B067E|nr:DUF1993 family protein [Sphingomonas faeni]MDQ0839289.1 hypothetical protein [Sphingomonas faeni]
MTKTPAPHTPMSLWTSGKRRVSTGGPHAPLRPPMADEETSFAALRKRIATSTFIESVPRVAIHSKEDATVAFTTSSGGQDLTSGNYVLPVVQPNFHITTAYPLLRMLSVAQR